MRFLELCQIADWEYTCVVPNSAGNAFNVLFLSQLFTIDFWQIFCIMLRKLFFFSPPCLPKIIWFSLFPKVMVSILNLLCARSHCRSFVVLVSAKMCFQRILWLLSSVPSLLSYLWSAPCLFLSFFPHPLCNGF